MTHPTPARTAEGNPLPVDIHVGARVRERREQLHLTQEQLGGVIGCTFQQIQKYERGFNRISCSRLAEISKALEVPPGYFFAGLPGLPDRPGEADPTPAQMLQWAIDSLSPANRRAVWEIVKAAAGIDGGAS